MSYLGLEFSIFGAKPVELYRFAYGTTHYNYTSADAAISYQGETYQAISIKRDAFAITQLISKSDFKISVSRDNPLAGLYIGMPPEGVVALTIYRTHQDGGFIVYWQGRVTNVGFTKSEAVFTCEPHFTAMKRLGLRALYSGLCRHALYSSGCGAQSSLFMDTGTVSSVDGLNISAAIFGSRADGWFLGGWVQFAAGAHRMITAHAGTQATVTNVVPGLSAGAVLTAYAGCDHLRTTCKDKFSNKLNFGGFSFIPNKNPFKGSSLIG